MPKKAWGSESKERPVVLDALEAYSWKMKTSYGPLRGETRCVLGSTFQSGSISLLVPEDCDQQIRTGSHTFLLTQVLSWPVP